MTEIKPGGGVTLPEALQKKRNAEKRIADLVEPIIRQLEDDLEIGIDYLSIYLLDMSTHEKPHRHKISQVVIHLNWENA